MLELTSEGIISNLIYVNVMEADNKKCNVSTQACRSQLSKKGKNKFIYPLCTLTGFIFLAFSAFALRICCGKKEERFILTLPFLLLLMLLKV